MTFKDLHLAGGSGYVLQLYLEAGTSTDVSFENVVLDASSGRYPLVIWGGWSDVRFKNVTLKMTRSDGVDVRLSAPTDVTFDGFTATGGYALVGTYSGQTNAKNITFANGAYSGSKVTVSGEDKISNLVVQNVKLNSTSAPATTGTTVAPTTTTTAAPKATTTTVKMTTTTVATTTTKATTTTTPTVTTKADQTTTTTTVPTTTTTPPTTTITQSSPMAFTSPADQSVVSGKVRVQVAVDAGLRVGKVRLYLDGRLLTQDYRAPFAFNWNTWHTASGSEHTLTAIAYDSRGNVLADVTETVTMAGANLTAAIQPKVEQDSQTSSTWVMTRSTEMRSPASLRLA